MGVDDKVSDSEVLVAKAFSDDNTSASRHAPARRPAIRNIIQESDSESERDEDVASKGVASKDVASKGVASEDVVSKGTTGGWVGETGVDFEGARGLQTQSDSYDRTETGKSCHCHCIVLHSPFMQSLPL